jgi:hypothetical protein
MAMIRLLILMLALSGWAGALIDVPLEPKDRIKLTGISDRIRIIEVTEVVKSEPEVEGAVESWKVTVKAKVLEVVRGEEGDGKFEHTVTLARVTDWEAREEELGRPADEMEKWIWKRAAQNETGILECVVGGRYLVVDVPLAGTEFFFIAVGHEDSWRGEVLELDPEMRKLFAR